MLNGILVVQKPLATLAITQRIVPLIHNNFDPLCVSCTLEVRSL
jgi:nanoRNase/pAp phosphatase (c-di-AMP/oligoRNAs hydrolase)